VAIGHAVERIQALERELRLPPTLTGAFTGTPQAFQASLSSTVASRRRSSLSTSCSASLRELHPPDHDPLGLPSAASRALLALMALHSTGP